MTRIAVLDDYQGVALDYADWTPVKARAEVTVFHDHLADPAALVERLRPFEVVCVMRERTPLTRAIMEQLGQLKLIITTGARNASIDMAGAKELGITICHTGGNPYGAMELTWALILAAARYVPAEYASVQAGGWMRHVGLDLHGSTLGIIGLGKIGANMARIGQAFGMNVIAWSQNLTEEAAAAAGVRRVEKADLLKQADFVTLHLVLSARSRGTIGAAELALMKPTTWLINTSRGPLVDEAAMLEAVRNRTIAGAALDVYDVEPLPKDHPLRTQDRVLSLPHVGYVTEASYKIFYHDIVEDILAWLDGTPKRVLE